MSDAPFRLDRAFIRVGGTEARAFLQNLLTQDMDRLTPAAPLYAGLLTPQGKLIADMLLWDEGDSVLIEADPSRAPALLQRLTMYRLRAPVEIADVSPENAALYFPQPGEAPPDPRMPDGALGFRRVVARDEAAGLPEGTDAHYRRRVAAGVPDLALDADPEEVFALEALFEELHGVDFKKGCFVGQENVSRMKRRATTRKKFCPVAFEGYAPAFNEPLLAGEVEIGQVLSGVDGRAIALLRLDRASEAEAKGVALTAEGRTIRLDPPPWLILPESAA